MVVIANVSRIRTFIYVILVLLLINLAVLAYIYLRYLGDGARPEIAPIKVKYSIFCPSDYICSYIKDKTTLHLGAVLWAFLNLSSITHISVDSSLFDGQHLSYCPKTEEIWGSGTKTDYAQQCVFTNGGIDVSVVHISSWLWNY